MTETAQRTATRGASSANKRGGTEERRRRKAWLVETYRADVDLVRVTWPSGDVTVESYVMTAETLLALYGPEGSDIDRAGLGTGAPLILDAAPVPTCRCYRCGALLSAETVTPDRIIPGCVKTARYPNGGTYVRENIRPACLPCNTSTGAKLARRKARR